MIDIGLTIWAWVRGWKAWALLPLGITIILAIIISVTVGIFSGSTVNMGGLIALGIIELSDWGVLIFMGVKGRKKEPQIYVNTPYAAPGYPPPVATPAPPPVNQIPAAPAPTPSVQPIEPATMLAKRNKAILVLSDNKEMNIEGPEKAFGRRDFEKLLSPDELKYISRQQFVIRNEAGIYYLEDKNSSNGTKINDDSVTGKGRCELKDGDRIKLADMITLQFRMSSA